MQLLELNYSYLILRNPDLKSNQKIGRKRKQSKYSQLDDNLILEIREPNGIENNPFP